MTATSGGVRWAGWYRFVAWLFSQLYYHRVSVIGARHLQAGVPTLCAGLHRNGAVDGYLYFMACPQAVFMISAQLRRSLLGRLLFAGIEVVRDKDEGDRHGNHVAMDHCLELLNGGGTLFVLPEGTSDLGPRHLPFKKGAARILATRLGQGGPVRVLPLGIHYERAWAWQSDVEIVAGEPLDLRVPDGLSDDELVELMHGRIAGALEAVGVNAQNAAVLAEWERIAYAATLGTGRSYFAALKALEGGLPEAIQGAREFERLIGGRRLLRHQGVPLVPIRFLWLYVLAFLTTAPVVVAAMVANIVPLAAGALAARKLADARNVIALWRLLAGAPALILWMSGLAVAAAITGHVAWFAAYAALTWCGLRLVYRVKKLGVAVCNGIFHADIRPALLNYHRQLDQAMRDAGC